MENHQPKTHTTINNEQEETTQIEIIRHLYCPETTGIDWLNLETTGIDWNDDSKFIGEPED